MDWRKCIDILTAKGVTPDRALIASLQETSRNRLATAALLPINETTSESVITLYYDSLRELLEAIANAHGYKIYNHECFTAFLREVLKKESEAAAFDRFRKLRNGINYYAKRVPPGDAAIIVQEIKELVQKCKKMLMEKST